MGFALLVVGGLVVMALVFIALGKWYPGTGADVLDWKPTRSYEDEIQLELEDVDQMIEAQNERRRRSGRPEISEDDFRAEVAAEERDLEARKAAYQQDHGEVLDELDGNPEIPPLPSSDPGDPPRQS